MNVHQEADQFLKDLINEADSIIEPDESKDWADAFLSRIRSFREKDGFMHSREAERAADRLGDLPP